MKPLLIHTRCFPPGSYRAITIFPFVFYKGSPLSNRELHHETIHLYQQAFLLIVPFYLFYLLFWLFALLRQGVGAARRVREPRSLWLRAYRDIPFERSAYRLESRPNLTRRTMAFDWLRCISSY